MFVTGTHAGSHARRLARSLAALIIELLKSAYFMRCMCQPAQRSSSYFVHRPVRACDCNNNIYIHILFLRARHAHSELDVVRGSQHRYISPAIVQAIFHARGRGIFHARWCNFFGARSDVFECVRVMCSGCTFGTYVAATRARAFKRKRASGRARSAS